MLKEQACQYSSSLRETKQKDRIVPTLTNAWSVEKVDKQRVGWGVPINRFGLQCQTLSMKIHVVGDPSNNITQCNTLQHVATLICFQSERTLLCKHGPFEGCKRRQQTVFLIRATRS